MSQLIHFKTFFLKFTLGVYGSNIIDNFLFTESIFFEVTSCYLEAIFTAQHLSLNLIYLQQQSEKHLALSLLLRKVDRQIAS